MTNWDLNLDNAPMGEPFLVLLAEAHTGSRIQVAMARRASNGMLMTVASCFASDVGRILGWQPLGVEVDDCELCGGVRGGVPGEENVVAGRTVCDRCHAGIKEMVHGG